MAVARGWLSGLWLAGLLAAPGTARAEEWEGPRLKPAAREEVFKFDRKPAVKRIGQDRFEISFASAAKCDAAVAIEGPAGKIVRHLAAGVLGPNAPEPFRKDSLEQKLVWDGKDDQGKYVAEPDKCRARVSLGLNPTFDKLLGWHPKDTDAERAIAGIAADKDGVYVLAVSCRNQLKMFDHDGNYRRTLVPFAGDLVNTKPLNVPTRPVEYTGRIVPALTGLGGLAPFASVEDYHNLAAAAGRIVATTSGYGEHHVLRLRTDGTTGGEPTTGPLIGKFGFPHGQVHTALSPDAKWIYMARLSRNGLPGNAYLDSKPCFWHTVFRVAWDGKGPVMEGNPYVGEVGRDPKAGSGAGDDARRLNMPKGIACDAAGRLYVCDTGNSRIQVFATDGPEGRLVKSIPFQNPQEIAVHQETGEIYVLCFQTGEGGGLSGGLTLFKLGPLDDPKVRMEHKFALRSGGDPRSESFVPVMGLDSWTKPAKVWMVTARGNIQIFADSGKTLESIQDFDKEVEKAGLRPHMLGSQKMNILEVDPVRGHLYYMRNGALQRCDPEGPGRMVPVKFPSGGWQEMDFSLTGLLHVRALTYLARFDPAKAQESKDGDVVNFPFESEVPFDYGEDQKIPWQERRLRGVLKIESLPGANGFDNGIGVAPNGDIVAFMKNYRTAEAGITANLGIEGGYIDGNELAGLKKQMSNMVFRPRIFPGRFANAAELIMRWDSRGEMLGEDLVPALPNPSAGVKTDRAGNIYVGIGAHYLMADGKPHTGGAVLKFPPSGGRVYGKGDLAQLKELPDRPAEFESYGWGKLWTRNLYWAYPGLDQFHMIGKMTYPCLCATCRFDLDLYGRSFVPKAYQFTVGVVDANGNVICEVGRYGNADTRGPKDSTVKIGGPEIAIAHCSYVATESDQWLYINDDGNNRVIRVKLGYHVEERVPLQ